MRHGRSESFGASRGRHHGAHVTFTVDDKKHLNISAVDAGYTVSGIVVKGAEAWNKYVPGLRGLSATAP